MINKRFFRPPATADIGDPLLVVAVVGGARVRRRERERRTGFEDGKGHLGHVACAGEVVNLRERRSWMRAE